MLTKFLILCIRLNKGIKNILLLVVAMVTLVATNYTYSVVSLAAGESAMSVQKVQDNPLLTANLYSVPLYSELFSEKNETSQEEVPAYKFAFVLSDLHSLITEYLLEHQQHSFMQINSGRHLSGYYLYDLRKILI